MKHRAQAYRLLAPTAESAIASLSRVLGSERASELFRGAAIESGFSPEEARALDVAGLRRVAITLARHEGIVSVLGLALQIRCDTYLALWDGGEP